MPWWTIARSVVDGLQRLRHDVRGASAVEYGLILVAVALAVMAGLSNITDGLKVVFNIINTNLANAR